jgi:AcrR family transcriptional regulator
MKIFMLASTASRNGEIPKNPRIDETLPVRTSRIRRRILHVKGILARSFTGTTYRVRENAPWPRMPKPDETFFACFFLYSGIILYLSIITEEVIVNVGLREKKNVAAKQALYEAAMELFRERGFEGTSVDAIAERAGFSRATFFNHFSTKQGVLRHYGQHLLERMEKLLATVDPLADPLGLIRQILLAMGEEAEKNREDLRIVTLYSIQDPDYRKEPTPARRRIREMLECLLSSAREKGQVRSNLPARELAMHIMSVYQGAVWAIVSGMGNAERLIGSAWYFILGGIGNGNSSAS